MRESRTPGSARGARSNPRPYRDPELRAPVATQHRKWRKSVNRATWLKILRKLGMARSGRRGSLEGAQVGCPSGGASAAPNLPTWRRIRPIRPIATV